LPVELSRRAKQAEMAPQSPLRLIIAAGGTGGHVLPAVAVVRELRSREIPLDTEWIGGTEGIEAETASAEGIRFVAIPTGKLRRYLDVRTARDAINIPRGVLSARRLVRAFRPDVVFSTGGFVSVPTVIACRGRAPILTHEQTTIIGLANKINLRFADELGLSFDDTRARVGKTKARIVVTGNPIRAELLTGDAERGRRQFAFVPDLPVLFVTGGARGASPLNQRIKVILPQLLEHTQILHQTGPVSANPDYAELAELKESLPEELAVRYVPTEYVREEIADVYAMADLVISRAGAGTVAELSALGKAAIMIPLPLSGGGEQIINARALADRGAGVMLMQDDATPDRLLSEIEALLADHERRQKMAQAAAALGRRDAAARLADELLALAGYSDLSR
jgi:UDP-N-acetylglucosamine--N-acetylmuramyl-(pentapeptide) pyrophosphoryl-undecaprenol N-acetylglucosamine transferase